MLPPLSEDRWRVPMDASKVTALNFRRSCECGGHNNTEYNPVFRGMGWPKFRRQLEG